MRYSINAKTLPNYHYKGLFKCIFLFIVVFSGQLRGTQKWYSHPWKEWMKQKSKGLVLYFNINDCESACALCSSQYQRLSNSEAIDVKPNKQEHFHVY
jgi:hypothetical protein